MALNQMDSALMTLAMVGQMLLLLILLQRRFYRTFPIFFLYILYSVLSDFLFLIWFRQTSEQAYFVAYFVDKVPEFLLELGVLYEVAQRVLSPVKKSLPKSSLAIFTAMIFGGTLVACLLSLHKMPDQLTRWSQYFVQLSFTVAILRLVIFSAIVFFSQMLGIGWKNHVMQIASGFLGYSVVVLLVEMLHRFSGVTNNAVYHFQEQFRIVAWCLALGYWSYVLAKKEAPRREFGPKMANLLVNLSHKVREDRAAAVRAYQD
jgi:hypothetical protein